MLEYGSALLSTSGNGLMANPGGTKLYGNLVCLILSIKNGQLISCHLSEMAIDGGYWDYVGVWVGATQHIWEWSDGESWWDEIIWAGSMVAIT